VPLWFPLGPVTLLAMARSRGERPTPRNLFSFSRLKSFHQCRARYRYRYLQGRREAFRSIESTLGNAVHEVLEWLYRERDRSASPDLGAALEALARAWNEALAEDVAVVRLADTAEAALRSGREMIERFHRTVFVRDRSETVALEKRLSMRLDDGLVFTGFADRVGRTSKGRLFVIDYKTSSREGDPSDFSEGLQAPLYAACTLEDADEDEALAGYHYLRHGTTRWHPVSRQRGRELTARFHALVLEATAATDFPANPSVLCAWCGFNAICPDAQVPDELSGGLRLARERATPAFGDPQPS